MKKLALILPLCFGFASCHTLESLLAVPAAVSDDVTGAVDAVTPGEDVAAVVETGTTIATGNPALGAAAGALVTGLAAWLLSRRKKAAA